MSKQKRWPFSMVTLRGSLLTLAWLISLGGALLAGAYGHKYRDKIRSLIRSVQASQILQTNLYNLTVQMVTIPGEGRDGAIDALGNGLLFVNRNGAMWVVDSNKTLHPVALTVPINVAEFAADPSNATTVWQERFSVKDILVQPLTDGVRLLASYTYWFADRDCYSLRVSSIETTVADLLRGANDDPGPWKTIFESSPCYQLSGSVERGGRHPTLGAGGRIATLSPNEVLLTVGGFGDEFAIYGAEGYWDQGNSYGKTIAIDLSTGSTRVFTVGHRNPQGLAVGSDSRVWLTEHAARGGDELNQLVDGANYGFPKVSYGTGYEMMTWPTNPKQGRHEGYTKPMFAWIPSLGISQVMVIERDAFPYWKGDLLVSSLGMETLYRVRIEDGRVIFVEPMMIDHRIRDLAELSDGTIALKTDDDFIIYLAAIDAGGAATANLTPSARGELLSAQCRGCHTFAQGGNNGIGPNLWDVMNRPIASLGGFTYSSALRAVSGRWDEETLRHFLGSPRGFAPGTSMEMTTTYNEQQLNDLIAYLQTLR